MVVNYFIIEIHYNYNFLQHVFLFISGNIEGVMTKFCDCAGSIRSRASFLATKVLCGYQYMT